MEILIMFYVFAMNLLEIAVGNGEFFTRSSYEDETYRGFLINNNLFSEFAQRSVIDCMNTCSLQSLCLSFSFHLNNKNCKLYNAVYTETTNNLIAEIGWRYFTMLGCPPSWIKHAQFCYYFDTIELKTWQESQSYCNSMGSYLAEVHTPEQQSFITTTAASLNESSSTIHSNSNGFWLGGSDEGNENTWTWRGTGSSFQISGWHRDEPNGGVNENCLMAYGQLSYDWVDIICSAKRNLICQRPV